MKTENVFIVSLALCLFIKCYHGLFDENVDVTCVQYLTASFTSF